MNNWSVDEEQLERNPEAYEMWRLSQMVNFGLGDGRISILDYKKYSDKVSIDDPWRKRYLDMLVYGEAHTH